MNSHTRTKVTIFGGAGGIGSSVAFNLMLRPVPYDVVVVDTRPNMVTSHVMDLQDITSLSDYSTVRGGTTDDAMDSDIVVLSAAVPLRLNTDRLEFLADNAAIVEDLAVPLISGGWDGVLVMMTNPVDALGTWLHDKTGIAREKLIGYTTNDSLRLRTGIAQAMDVHPRSVEAWVIGEHGQGQVPVLSSVKIDGTPTVLTTEQLAAVHDYVDTWYVKHVALDSGRASTWSSGLGTALLLDAIATDSDEVVTGSVVLRGEYGVDGTSLGVPMKLGRQGVREILEWDLSESERSAMLAAHDHVKAAADSLQAPIQ